ncbi:hypothetical protein Pan44_34260 [Caulifigura coniformis]|uniref:Cell division protein FtsL n=1 Tax=Caulifigura coniformis TaxID=2527983 RepID=A0A517SGY1_9PLAN|nr:hypothetical protein [Caulifigura coniformis]QDT55383.1 hypothetical protein Pan44_34260 [Caulifigura coniformis]
MEPGSNASAHLLRFGAAMAILVAIALAGVALEQRSLELSRQFSLQTFRADRLEQEAAALRLRIEELQTPQRLMEARQLQDRESVRMGSAEGPNGLRSRR